MSDGDNKTFDVVVVGSIFMDLISYADRLPIPGETIGGTDFQTGYGGKGANQCVAAQRLGAKTAFVGKVGSDANGTQYLNNLKSEGVNVDSIMVETEIPTGVASIMVGNDTGANMIITVAGANSHITPTFVENTGEEVIKNSKTLLTQLEIPLDSTLTALKFAKSHNVFTIFNAAPAISGIPKDLYPLVDILCVNEPEAQMLTGVQTLETFEDAKTATEILTKDLGCKNVIITLGNKGATLWEHGQETFTMVHAPKVTAVDTTGAGDCFMGTLAYCLSKDVSLKDAVKKAVLCASESVKGKGTQSSFPHSIPK